MSEESFIQHDVENKQLKEENKKLNENENDNDNDNDNENENDNENQNENDNDSDDEKERKDMFKNHNFKIFRCNPNNPQFDLFKFLGEIILYISKLHEKNAVNRVISKITDDF